MQVRDSRWELLFGHYPKEVLGRFREFHEANPEVYEEFKKLAYQMKATGRRKYSCDAIIHVLRWNFDLETRGDDEFKINNNIRSLYGRLLAWNDENFMTFFEFRRPHATIQEHGESEPNREDSPPEYGDD